MKRYILASIGFAIMGVYVYFVALPITIWSLSSLQSEFAQAGIALVIYPVVMVSFVKFWSWLTDDQ